MSERIVWSKTRWAEEGVVGGLRLFTVGYGSKRQDDMWHLSTSLPLSSPVLGQHYPTPTHAKIAAEQLLAAFVQRLTPTTDQPGRVSGDERGDQR